MRWEPCAVTWPIPDGSCLSRWRCVRWDIDEVFAAGGADRIMFDNFTVEMTREGVRRIAGRCETESSGGIREETMRAYAECGVDYVSVGALTHQIRSLDMSLKACV